MLGWGIFFVSFVVAIILFSRYKRIYPVFYLISVALYIFTAGFIIDVYKFQEFGILATLVFSAIVFMILGYYLSKIMSEQSQRLIK